MNILFVVIVLALAGCEPKSTSQRDSNPQRTSLCTFSSSSEEYDLQFLRARKDFNFTSSTNFSYFFNICSGTRRTCNHVVSPASKWRDQKCNNLGVPGTQVFALLDDADPSKGLRLTYMDGDLCTKETSPGRTEIASREVRFDVLCDPDEEGLLVRVDESRDEALGHRGHRFPPLSWVGRSRE
mmetsp:Transcript_39787/g.65959  ORF Transcript_39787/g.65959 Transcript_39787/m.65959 type:complete len:183 (-) Transcript_39787:420-968(-)